MASVCLAQPESGQAPFAEDPFVTEVREALGEQAGIELEPVRLQAVALADLGGVLAERLLARGRDYWELRHALELAAGASLEDWPSADALRRSLARTQAEAIGALYDPRRQAVLVAAGPTGWEALVDQQRALVRALADVWRDRAPGGLLKLERGEVRPGSPATLDARSVRRAVLAGQAELMAQALNSEAEAPGSELDALVGSERALVQAAGWRWLQGQAKHRERLRPALRRLPPSSELLLHPSKQVGERAASPRLPAAPAGGEVLLDTSLGELELLLLLHRLRVDQTSAERVALGWNGDRLRLLGRGRQRAILWRSQWDRPLDARQAQALLSERLGGRWILRGTTLDWAWSTQAEETGRLAALLAAAAPGDSKAASGAAATARLEAELARRARQRPRVEGGRWLHPPAGLSLPIPKGWRAEAFRGALILRRDGDDLDFSDNVNVLVSPAPAESLAAYAELNRQEAAGLGLKLVRCEVVAKPWPRVELEYDGRFPGQPVRLHVRSFAFLRGGQQVVVTVTVRGSRWRLLQAQVEQFLAGVRRQEAAEKN